MALKYFLFCFFVIIYLSCFNYLHCLAYEEIDTSQGKVVAGISEDEALERFGLPIAVGDGVWSYIIPEKFFVYFSGPDSLNLYPKFCRTAVGIPVELKAFIRLANSKIRDISDEVKLLISKPEDFFLEKTGVIIPKKEGDYQVIGKYKNMLSEPAYIKVQKPKEEEKEEEKLLSIDILPYKPKLPVGGHLRFVALGTFFNASQNKYSIRDLSEEALWSVQQDNIIKKVKDREIVFSSSGSAKVFCQYRDIKSFCQEVEVQEAFLPPKQTLRHILLLPDFMLTAVDNPVNLRVFGTYYNNRVEEITSGIDWGIKNAEMLEIRGSGELNPKSEGISEVTARSGKIESSPIKIVIVSKDKFHYGISEAYKSKETKDSPADLMQEIKSSVNDLSRNIAGEKKMLKYIKIMPEYLHISLGEGGEFTATGVYSDNSEDDLTKIAVWISSNNEIIAVSKGKVSGASVGKADVYAEFRGQKSLPAVVVVEGPKLVSIALSPQGSKLSMGDRLQLKAEGYFSDSSHKDITSLVAWNILGPPAIRVEKGNIRPVRFGQTKVYAEHVGIRSLPVDISVILTWDWLLRVIFNGVLAIILVIIMMFIILYILTVKERKKLLALYGKPNEFIVALYENLRQILNFFDLRYEEFLAPLTYAELIEKKLSLDNRMFLRITNKFEEAKYSRHILRAGDASLILNDYNNFLKILIGKYKKFSLFFKHCLILWHKRPFFLWYRKV